MHPNQRGSAIPSSATLSISAKAKQMTADGLDVVNFGVGQPDFATPAHIVDAAKRALDGGAHGYTPTAGTPVLREAVAAELSRVTGNTYGPTNVFVSNGAKQCLHNLMQVLVDPGDEVLVPAPYWVSYVPMVQLAGGVPKLLPTSLEDGFRLTPDQLREALSPRSKVLILNSPSNPTGAAYGESELRALAEVVTSHPHLAVLSDEIYRQLTFDGFKHVSFASLGPEAAARTFVIDGVSKAYAMTGWRIGYAAGPAEVIAAAIRYQDHTTSCASAGSQAAAVAAITGPQDAVAMMLAAFTERRKVLLYKIDAIPGVSVHPPQGAFYAFLSLEGLGATGVDDDAFCQRLLDDAHVAAVPGFAFGAPGHMRLSFACSMERLIEGLDRIGDFVR
ncbi:MAG: pyridoxal phosphate-dependent aminotransferase [bacterium]